MSKQIEQKPSCFKKEEKYTVLRRNRNSKRGEGVMIISKLEIKVIKIEQRNEKAEVRSFKLLDKSGESVKILVE